MKPIILLTLLFNICLISFSQEIVILNNGEKIQCKITKEDSVNLYVIITRNDNEINSFISKKEVQKVIYEKDIPNYEKDLAQNKNSDSIIVQRKGLGYQYYLKDKCLSVSDLSDVLITNDNAYAEFQKAKSTNVLANIFGCAGGFMIGWPIGTALGGGKPEWALLGVGVCLVVIAIPIINSAENQAKTAVDIYNHGLKKTSYIKKELQLKFANNVIHLSLKF